MNILVIELMNWDICYNTDLFLHYLLQKEINGIFGVYLQNLILIYQYFGVCVHVFFIMYISASYLYS